MFTPFTSLEIAAANRPHMPSPFCNMSRREISRYSLSTEIRRILFGGARGLEADCTSAAFAGRHRDSAVSIDRTIVVPPQIFARAMATTPGPKGGYMVPTDGAALGVVDALRPLSVVLRAGAQSVPGFVSNVAVPRQSGGATVAWQGGEGANTTAADPALGQLSITARSVVAIVNLSQQLLVQAPQVVDTMLARELGAAIATELDRVALQGVGGTQPLGVLNTPDVPTVSGTSLAAAGLISCQRKLLDNNGQSTPLGAAFVTTPAIAEALAQRTNFATGTSAAIWQGSLAEGRILGTPAYATPNCGTASLVYGDFSRLLIAEFFDGIELSFQHASFGAATIAARAMLTCDVAIEHQNSFVVSTSIT